MIHKFGVEWHDMHPAIEAATSSIEKVYAQFGVPCVCTSARDGKHSPKSLHYSGRAIDLRTRQLGNMQQLEVTARLRKVLGPDFDVVLESDHLHIEFDPKTEPLQTASLF